VEGARNAISGLVAGSLVSLGITVPRLAGGETSSAGGTIDTRLPSVASG
jgi:thymidine phosphorylase